MTYDRRPECNLCSFTVLNYKRCNLLNNELRLSETILKTVILISMNELCGSNQFISQPVLVVFKVCTVMFTYMVYASYNVIHQSNLKHSVTYRNYVTVNKLLQGRQFQTASVNYGRISNQIIDCCRHNWTSELCNDKIFLQL